MRGQCRPRRCQFLFLQCDGSLRLEYRRHGFVIGWRFASGTIPGSRGGRRRRVRLLLGFLQIIVRLAQFRLGLLDIGFGLRNQIAMHERRESG